MTVKVINKRIGGMMDRVISLGLSFIAFLIGYYLFNHPGISFYLSLVIFSGYIVACCFLIYWLDRRNKDR